MMMDSAQTASTQPTEELTELGKCLMKYEVSLKHKMQYSHSLNSLYKLSVFLFFFFFFPYPEHLHVPVDPRLHLTVMEGHHKLSPHCFHGLLDSSAAGSTQC